MDPGVIGVFIPIIAIVMGVGAGIVAIWSEHKRKAQLLEQNHRERMQAIEKGLELPPLPANLVSGGNGPATASAATSVAAYAPAKASVARVPASTWPSRGTSAPTAAWSLMSAAPRGAE